MNVSIGVLAYNEEQNIEIVINSLLKQKTFSVNIREIIIVSSGSNDKTNEIVEKISDKNKKVRLIKE